VWRSEQRHTPAIENAVYRMVQEALTNVVKHADATRVKVAITESEDRVELCVQDDGTGFDPQAPAEGFGLVGIRERVALIDGELSIESRPGQGTTVRATLPVLPADRRRASPAARTASP
jgi:signal transduction histidine kinase